MAYYLFCKKSSFIILLCLIISTGWFSYLTYARNIIWNDEFVLWDDTVRKSPNKIRPRNARANAYLNKGNIAMAMSDLHKAIEIYQKSLSSSDYRNKDRRLKIDKDQIPSIAGQASETFNTLGLIYSRLKEDDKAIDCFTEAIRINPYNTYALDNRGATYRFKGEFDKAITDFSEAIRINPNFVEVWFNRAEAYGNKGDYLRALSDYTQAIELYPNYAKAYNNRGLIYAYFKNYKSAIFDFSQALRIEPRNIFILFNRANIYRAMGEFEKADYDLSEAAKINPNFNKTYEERPATNIIKKTD